MNNYFNFTKPYFNEQFGEDWTSFDTIVDTQVDYVYQQTVRLYWLKNICQMPLIPLEYSLRLRAIKYSATDTPQMKKNYLRKFNTAFKEKGMESFYLDYQEAIVGTRGDIYNGYTFGTLVWGITTWPISGSPESTDRIWSTTDAPFEIFINCKTTDSTLLDQLVEIYRQTFMLPAFYQIYLIDDDFNILRTV